MSRSFAPPSPLPCAARPRAAVWPAAEVPSRRGSGAAIGWLGTAVVALGAAIGWLGGGRDGSEPPAIGVVPPPPDGERPAPVALVGDRPGEPEREVADPARDRRLGAAIRQARSSSVSLEYIAGGAVPIRRVASGVVINDQGDLLSVRIDPPARGDGPPIVATDSQGHRHPVRWLAADPDTGLTLLKLPAGALPPVRLAANDAALGSEVFLVSNPYGLGHSISRGHVGGLDRRLTIAGQVMAGLIQVQAPIHPGDSGAPLADLNGGWLGLVRGGLAMPNPAVGQGDDLAFVIPARDALWVADQLRASGRVDRAFLGLRFAADAALATLLLPLGGASATPAPDPGVTVKEVLPGSPAAQARLQAGDRVVRIDDRPITGATDLVDRLERTAAGAQVALEYIRSGVRDRITLRTGSRPTGPDQLPKPHDTVDPADGDASTAQPTAAPISPPSPASVPALIPTLVPKSDDTAALIRSLQGRIEQLEQRLGALERERSTQGSSPAAPR